jgi:N-methylhydantoinase A
VVTVTDDGDALLSGDVSASDAAAAGTRMVRDTTTGEVASWSVYDRSALAPGARIAGPAIVAEDETSTLVCPGWDAVVNGLGYIEMTREST